MKKLTDKYMKDIIQHWKVGDVIVKNTESIHETLSNIFGITLSRYRKLREKETNKLWDLIEKNLPKNFLCELDPFGNIIIKYHSGDFNSW